MSINKVIFGDETLIDLTSDTVKPSLLMSGITAHDCAGTSITGTVIARTASDIEVAGPTISVPSGAYPSAVTKTVASGAYYSQFNLSINLLNIQLNNTTGKININQNSSLNTTIIKTTGYIERANSVGHFSASVSSSYQLPTISAATYTPTTSDQTIAAGSYLTGAQTIKGDANLIAANIASGVTIFGITGTHSGGITPTGTITISSNGIYDVTNYASASIKVGAVVDGSRLIVPEGMIGV